MERQDTILLIGCNVHKEVPLAGTRVRKAWLNGASIFSINAVDYEQRFTLTKKIIVAPQEMPLQLATLLKSLVKGAKNLPVEVQKLVLGLEG